MAHVDQRGFDDQPALTPAEAAAYLGVKLPTLYAYVSRGRIRRVAGRYLREDLERLRARRDARAGHGPVAAGALRWGEPVLDSAITRIDGGLAYRGRDALALADSATFEAVCELLWTGLLPSPLPAWPRAAPPRPPTRVRPIDALAAAVPRLAARAPAAIDAPLETELTRARALVRALAAAPAPGRVAGKSSVAEALAASLQAGHGAAGRRAIERALVLTADHELNASSFVARVVASTGADLHACVAAALAALSGPRHGGACDLVEALVDEVGRPARAAAFVRERTRRGETLVGFHHLVYPAGDPRAPPLLEEARRLAPRDRRVATALALVDAAGGAPTVDWGLVALAAALGLPPGGAICVFAVGRSAGWIAHALEQRAAGFMLRPRARYVGP